MKPARIDRLFTVFTAAALTAWTGCLVLLWAQAFDSGGASTLVTLAAAALAISCAMYLPGRFARFVQRVLMWLKIEDVGRIEPALAPAPGAGPRQARTMLRLMGTTTILAVICALAATGAALAGRFASDRLAGILWGDLAWVAAKLVVQFAGMLPMGLALALTFLAGVIVRGGSGRDIYAIVFRDMLWGLGGGLIVFALAWTAGAHLAALAAIAPVPMLAAALAFLFRRKATVRPRRSVRAIVTRAPRGLGIAAGFAMLSIVLVVQIRLMGDGAGWGVPEGAVWAAASLSLLAVFLGKTDRKSHPPGQGQALAATIGVTVGLLLQTALVQASLAGGGAIFLPMAAAFQVPLAAMAAIVLSRQRHLFAGAGGRGQAYAARAAAGAGVGFLVYLGSASSAFGTIFLLGGALCVCALAVIRGISIAARAGGQVRWAVWGSALIVSSSGALLASLPSGEKIGVVTRGVWLSSVSKRPPTRGSPFVEGCLPRPPTWRGAGVTGALGRILSAWPGTWWAVTSSDRDLPTAHRSVRLARSAPDASCIPRGAWRGQFLAGSDGDFLSAAGKGRDRFDGVFLAPLPADHAQAWRCYNYRTLLQSARRAHPARPILLRTQASGDCVPAVLAVARTFHDAVSADRQAELRRGRFGMWAVVELGEGAIDLLLVAGPRDVMAGEGTTGGAFVLRLHRIVENYPDVRAIRLIHPGRMRRTGRVTLEEFRQWLLGTRNSEPGTRNSELGTRNPEPGTRNSELGTRNPELGTRNPELGTRNSELGTRNSELGTRNSVRSISFLPRQGWSFLAQADRREAWEPGAYWSPAPHQNRRGRSARTKNANGDFGAGRS